MGFSYNVNVLNQKGSPAIYTDTFANRPAPGFVGRLFIANDTSAIYEDTGTAWVLIANVSSGAGTLQQVTTNGNTSNVGISVTAGGISSNTLTVTSLTGGSVAFVGASDLITEDNANLFWDDTNNRLGIGTNNPGNVLDLHSALTTAILALNNTAGNQSLIAFVNNSVAKWRIGNTAANNFEILNVGLSAIALTINVSDNSTDLGNNSIFSAFSYLTGLTSGSSGQTNLKIGTTTSGVPGGYYSIVPLSSGVLNFSSNLSAGNYRIFNIDSNSLTDSTTRTFTLPDASGTVALTSNLSAYLPLAGGTLTGNLIGTTASLSVASGNNQFSITAPSGSFSFISLIQSSIGTWGIQNTATTGEFKITESGVADRLTISKSTGNALFSGEISIANSNPILSLNNNGGGSGQNFGLQSFSDGNLYLLIVGLANRGVFDGVTGVYTPLSDKNKKKDFEESFIGLNAILGLKPTLYRMLTEQNTEKHLGFIAQEVKEFIPQAFVQNNDFIGLNYQAITATLVKGMQEQQKIIEGLIKRIEQLENK
jgi:hypothetical protein